MIEFLNQPSPINIEYPKKFKQALFAGLFIFVFFFEFKPFGLSNETMLTLFKVSVANGLATVFIGILNAVLIPFMFPSFFNELKWNLKRNFLLGFWNLLSVTIIIYITNNLLLGYYGFSFKGFFEFMAIVLSIGLPIAIITGIVNQNYLLKKHIKIAESINVNLKKNKSAISDSMISFDADKFKKVQFPIDKLIYIQGLGNYLNVYYENNGIKKLTIRETFGNLEKRLSGSKTIYKPHRSYIINLQYIKKLTGDSQGLKIQVKNLDTVIPVSRSKTNEFKQICSGQMDA